MSNSDASIDPYLRNIASSSTIHFSSPLAPVNPTPLPPGLNHERSWPYPQSQHLHNSSGTYVDDLNGEGRFNDLKRSRACEACRGLKVRCEPDPNSPDNPCKRCAKANRICIVTAPSRKRRKKTDSRVAELEKKIDALTASLAAQRSGNMPIMHRTSSEETTSSIVMNDQLRSNSLQQPTNEASPLFKSCSDDHGESWSSCDKAGVGSKIPTTTHPKVVTDQNSKHTDINATQNESPSSTSIFSKKCSEPNTARPDFMTKPKPNNEYVDVINRKILSSEIASKIFDDFMQKMAPNFPIVAFPPGTTSTNVRKSTPILFLAILSTGCCLNFIELQKPLTDELMSVFAGRIICDGDKSLELIQALQISSLWYWPTDQYRELHFYQLIHIALVMAIDMGIGKKRKRSKSKAPNLYKISDFHRSFNLDVETIETRRAWLGCYWLCCNVSMILRRPNLIYWNSYIANCVDILENSPESLPSDKIFCHLVKLQHIAEDTCLQFSLDDSEALVRFSDSQVQHSLKGFERDLEKWKSNIKPENMSPTLSITEHVTNLYMHEVATHVDHDIDDLEPPFTEETIQALAVESDNSPLSSARVTALSICLISIDGIFEIFLNFDIEIIRSLPCPYFGWLAYALVILVKMYFAAATPHSELGKVINKDNMKVEQYFDRLIDKLQAASGEDKYQPSTKFTADFGTMRTWFYRQKERKPSEHGIISSTKNSLKEDSDQKLKEKMTQSEPPAAKKNKIEYGSDKTMLQLLSEIATEKSIGQSALDSTNNCSNSTNEWLQPLNFSYTNYSTGLSSVNQTYNQITLNGNIDPSLSMDLNYTSSNGLQNATTSVSGIGEFGSFLGDDALFGGLMSSVYTPNMGFEDF